MYQAIMKSSGTHYKFPVIPLEDATYSFTWFSLTMTGVLSFGLLTRPMWSLDLVCSGLQWHRVKAGSSRGWTRHRKSRGLGTEKTRLWRSRGPAGNEDLLTVMVQSLSSTVMLCTLTLPDEVRWNNTHNLKSCIKHNLTYSYFFRTSHLWNAL